MTAHLPAKNTVEKAKVIANVETRNTLSTNFRERFVQLPA